MAAERLGKGRVLSSSESLVEVLSASALLILLLLACRTDLRERRIPNALVATVLCMGIIVATALEPLLPGFLRALAGFGVGLVIWLPGWLLRMMGAGDVKLFAAVGAWLGPLGTINAAFLAAVAGGVLALIWIFSVRGSSGAVRTLLSAIAAPRTLIDARADTVSARDDVPYSLAITCGVALQLIFPGLLLG